MLTPWSALAPGLQLVLLCLFVGLVLVFIKMNSYERRLQNVEDSFKQYVPYEDYMETFNNMYAAAARGESVAPHLEADLPDDQDDEAVQEDN